MFYFHPYLGKWSNFTDIFTWVGSTTNWYLFCKKTSCFCVNLGLVHVDITNLNLRRWFFCHNSLWNCRGWWFWISCSQQNMAFSHVCGMNKIDEHWILMILLGALQPKYCSHNETNGSMICSLNFGVSQKSIHIRRSKNTKTFEFPWSTTRVCPKERADASKSIRFRTKKQHTYTGHFIPVNSFHWKIYRRIFTSDLTSILSA